MNLEILEDLKVLYVEDEEDILKQTSMVLEDFIGKLYIAKDGEEALKIALEEPIDLIVTDILIPKKNGIEFLEILKNEHDKSFPTIITTAHTDAKYLLSAINNLDVRFYIIKPINIKELLKAMYDLILPIIQKRELLLYKNILTGLTVFVGGKKIEIIKYILNNLDKDNTFNGTYNDIMQNLNVSKPTVIKLFKELIDGGILERVRNSVYKFKTYK